MNGNFWMTFFVLRETIKDSVPKDIVNSSAATASLALTGNPIVPFMWIQEKKSDEQEKESLRVDARSRISVDPIINKLNNKFKVGQVDESALTTQLREIFEPPQLEQLRAAAEKITTPKSKLSILLQNIVNPAAGPPATPP